MDKEYTIAYTKSVVGNSLNAAMASTAAMDRDGDIVDPLGVELSNFNKNPLLLWSHDHRQLPIGKITDIRVSNKGIEFDAEFAVAENPFAKQVRDLMAGGFLNAFSIGFIGKERNDDTITKSELIEISVVNVPANAEALLSRQYKSFEKSIKELEEKNYMDEKKPEEKKDEKSVEVKEEKPGCACEGEKKVTEEKSENTIEVKYQESLEEVKSEHSKIDKKINKLRLAINDNAKSISEIDEEKKQKQAKKLNSINNQIKLAKKLNK